MKTLISTRQVAFRQGERQILSDISLALREGEITSVIGPNGAGKTSLVRILLGLNRPTSGTIHRVEKLRIGYMPQKLNVNTTLPLKVKRFLNLAAHKAMGIDEALQLAGATQLREMSLHKLSGGETQRVLLARALLAKPQLLVLDEPAQGVDITGQEALYQRISDLRDTLHCAVLVVSHDLHWVMAKTDSVICLNQHICCHGHPQTVSTDPAYLTLFGQQAETALAPYVHEHDHAHSIDGDVIGEGGCQHD